MLTPRPVLRSLPLTVLAATLLAATLLAPALRAQTPRPAGGGEDVAVALEPPFPIVGRPFAAVVRFATLRPERVTVFLRPVGTLAYEGVDALATADAGVFRVTLPSDVPEVGLDVFAEYVVGGVTSTQPAQSPRERPFRVPSFTPNSESAAELPARQYRMVTVPLVLETGLPAGVTVSGIGSDEPDDVFGDDFGPGADPAQWRLLRFDPATEREVDYAVDPLRLGRVRPGAGFWLITASGGRFDVEAGLSTGVVFEGGRPFGGPVTVPIGPGWNQIGSPYLFGVAWDDVGQSGLVEDPVAFRGTYEPAQATLRPWEGYFVFNRGGASSLVFEALPGSASQTATRPARTGERPGERLLRRAGPGSYVLDVRAEAGGRADHVYLGVSTTGEGVDLRKPPAVDAGLRLVVRDEGRALAASVRTSGDAASGEPSWTLETVGGVALVFEGSGVRPAGTRLAVDDLDRGVVLDVSGDVSGLVGDARVDVPVVASATVRRLRVRLVADGEAVPAAPAVSLGRPYPAPTAGGVTVPLDLAEAAPVRLDVVDVLGRLVRQLYDGPLGAGRHNLRWDGRDASGGPAAPGVYVVRLQAPGASASARVTVLR